MAGGYYVGYSRGRESPTQRSTEFDMLDSAFQNHSPLACGLSSAAPIMPMRAPNGSAMASRTLQRRRPIILLAEDDDVLRSITQELLRSSGYEVWACCDGLKALQVHSLLGRVDLLVSDIDMPFVSGIELAAALTERQPGLRVILNSGSALTQEKIGLVARYGWRFLQKPFRVQVLLDSICSHFASPAAQREPAQTQPMKRTL